MPRLVMVKLPPVMSAMESLSSRARATSCDISSRSQRQISVGVADHRHHQPIVHGNSHPQVDRLNKVNAAVGPSSVEIRVFLQSCSDYLDQDVVVGDAKALPS